MTQFETLKSVNHVRIPFKVPTEVEMTSTAELMQCIASGRTVRVGNECQGLAIDPGPTLRRPIRHVCRRRRHLDDDTANTVHPGPEPDRPHSSAARLFYTTGICHCCHRYHVPRHFVSTTSKTLGTSIDYSYIFVLGFGRRFLVHM